MKENIFYTKTKYPKDNSQTNILEQLNASTKLQINWDLVQKGADVNQVFKNNPCGLDAFLATPIKTANETQSKSSGRENAWALF